MLRLIVPLLVGIGIALGSAPALGQDDGPEATIAALETQVAALQTQIAELSMPADSGTPTPAASAASETASFLFGEPPMSLPVGDPGVVDVIAVGAPVRASVPIVVRNNTATDVALEDVLGTARNQAGELVLAAQVSSMSPYLLRPGGIAAGSVYFGEDVPPDMALEFEPQADEYELQDFGFQDLVILEASVQGSEIVGIAKNPLEEELSGPFRVVAVCFDASGEISGYSSAFAAKDDLAPGETTPFSAAFYGEGPCDTFLLGASGFKGM